jgi:DnaK suppressor protein
MVREQMLREKMLFRCEAAFSIPMREVIVSVLCVRNEINAMKNHAKVKAELQAKLKALYARALDIEDILSDPGNSDWEENAIEMENDEAWAAVGDVTKEEIREIRLALRRIERGDYGKCESCGKPIAPARLEALPWTAFCIGCA